MKKQILKDLEKIINEFLREEINLNDVKRWLQRHPDKRRLEKLSEQDVKFIKSIFNKLDKLTSKSININEWDDIKRQIADYLIDVEK